VVASRETQTQIVIVGGESVTIPTAHLVCVEVGVFSAYSGEGWHVVIQIDVTVVVVEGKPKAWAPRAGGKV